MVDLPTELDIRLREIVCSGCEMQRSIDRLLLAIEMVKLHEDIDAVLPTRKAKRYVEQFRE